MLNIRIVGGLGAYPQRKALKNGAERSNLMIPDSKLLHKQLSLMLSLMIYSE